jgi:hypothetical protein
MTKLQSPGAGNLKIQYQPLARLHIEQRQRHAHAKATGLRRELGQRGAHSRGRCQALSPTLADMTATDGRRKPHHRPDGFQNNYAEFTSKTLADVLRWRWDAGRRGLPPPPKLFYLGELLEPIRTTYFRQVMFAEFQLQMHEEVEQGRPLSGECLTQMYCTLLKRYYGEAEGVMKIDPLYCTEWEFIPHFYYG